MLFRYKKLVTIILAVIFLGSVLNVNAAGDTIEQLKSQIDAKTVRIKEIEAEIAKYQSEIGKTQEEAQSLKTTIAQLDAMRTALQNEISVTSAKIDLVDTTIEKLNLDISQTQKDISIQSDGLRSAIRALNISSDKSAIEVFFSRDTISEVWNEVAILSQVQSGMLSYKDKLASAKSALESQQTEKEKQKKLLVDLSDKLSDQKQIAETNRQTKAVLLKQTKNKESAYQKMLSDKKKLKEQIEQELFTYESQLKIAFDAARLPGIGSEVLAWPLDNIIVTQQFGDTAFSRTHALVYSGKGHNGIDLGVRTGTPVYAARSGVVKGTGNTDLGCPGGSYGKWILIEHDNGISTLYAHLSLIKVTEGQQITTHDLIAYSGNTGYTTGPHLHFTVYASQGVNITNVRANGTISSCGKMPVSPLNGYLNPLLYLPAK